MVFARSGIGEMVALPPGQRTQIREGASGTLKTITVLSWDQ